eukprot:1958409-Pleurochrysis_carterae.AAC.2
MAAHDVQPAVVDAEGTFVVASFFDIFAPQGDNLALYEKVRFLQSRLESKPGGADAATHISISDESTEAAYKELYEEKMNPFAAFHK